MRWINLIKSTFAILGAGSAYADITPSDWVTTALASTRAPGVVMGVSQWGDIRIASGGLRAMGGASVTDDDLWHIGSNTKSMTATLVARLAEAGVIDWDDTIGSVFGGVIDIDPAYENVSYAALLMHQSGLPANLCRTKSLLLAGVLADRDITSDRLSYVGQVRRSAPVRQGTFLYSNAGYVVAGAMLEQTTGQTWEALMQSYLFNPLGLNSADFGAPTGDQPQGHRGRLFLRPIKTGAGADNIPALGPAGTVHINARDMLRYLDTHAQRDSSFLRAESWARLHTPLEGAITQWAGL